MGWFDWMYSALASLGMWPPSEKKFLRCEQNGTRHSYWEMARKTSGVTILRGRFRFQKSVEEIGRRIGGDLPRIWFKGLQGSWSDLKCHRICQLNLTRDIYASALFVSNAVSFFLANFYFQLWCTRQSLTSRWTEMLCKYFDLSHRCSHDKLASFNFIFPIVQMIVDS